MKKILAFFLLLLPALSPAAITYVGGTGGAVGGFASSLAVTYTATGGAGNILVAHTGQYFYTTNMTSVTWKGTNFTFVTGTAGFSSGANIWYLVAPSSGLGTLNFTPAQGTNLSCIVEEYSGINASSPIGAKSVYASLGGLEFANPGYLTITTTNNNSFISASVFGVQGTNPVASTFFPSGGSSFLRRIITAPSTNQYPTGGVGDYLAATAGSFIAGFNFTGGGNGDIFVAAELNAAPSPTSTNTPVVTSTYTSTITATSTPSPTRTITQTATPTYTVTPSATPTATPTTTPTATATVTPIPCTASQPDLPISGPFPLAGNCAWCDTFDPSAFITQPFAAPCAPIIAAASSIARASRTLPLMGLSTNYARVFAQSTTYNAMTTDLASITNSARNHVFRVPTQIPNAAIMAWPMSGSASGILGKPVLLNTAQAWYLQQQGTGGGGIPTGDTITAIGNFQFNGLTPEVIVADGVSNSKMAVATSWDPYSVSFVVPGGLSNGYYTAWVSNGRGGTYRFNQGGPLPLTIAAAPTYPGATFNVLSYGAVGNGIADDTAALKYCVTASAAVNGKCYIPTGTYKQTSGVQVPSNAYIYGDGSSLSKIVGATNFDDYYGWGDFNGSKKMNVTVKDLSFNFNSVSSSTMSSVGNYIFQMTYYQRVVFQNISISATLNQYDGAPAVAIGFKTGGGSNVIGPMLATGVKVYAYQGFDNFPDNSIIQDCFFYCKLDGFSVTANGVANLIYRRNTVRDFDQSVSTGFGCGRGGVLKGSGSLTNNVYWGGNDTDGIGVSATKVDKNSGDGHILLVESGDIAHVQQCTPTAATLTSITVPNDSGSNYACCHWAVGVVNGPGMGQMRPIISDTAGLLTVAAWDETPTTQSYVVVSPIDYNFAVYNNHTTNPGHRTDDSASGVQFGGPVWNAYVDKNTIEGMHQGIYTSAYSPTSTQVMTDYFHYIQNNTVYNSVSSAVSAGYGMLIAANFGSISTLGSYISNIMGWDNSITSSAAAAVRLDVVGGSSSQSELNMNGASLIGNTGSGNGLSKTTGTNLSNLVDEGNFWSTATQTFTPTFTPTVTPTITVTSTVTQTSTPSATLTRSSTASPTPSVTATPKPNDSTLSVSLQPNGTPVPVAAVYKSFSGLSVSGTTLAWTAAVGKKIRLLGYSITGSIAGNYQLASSAFTWIVPIIPGVATTSAPLGSGAPAGVTLTVTGPVGATTPCTASGTIYGGEE